MANGYGSFPPSNTFWTFLSQVLDTQGSCREALRRFQAWLFIEEGGTISSKTAAYCKARARLCTQELRQLAHRIAGRMEEECPSLWHGRKVMVLDGSALSMPDTPENQAVWPQSSRSKPGCGFPLLRIAALFSLATGAMVGLEHGPLSDSERTLGRRLWRFLEKGSVLLADRGFCGFADFCLLAAKGVDCVMRKNGRRKNASVIRRLGKNDTIVEWKRAKGCPRWMSIRRRLRLPESIAVREVVVRVETPGFRTQVVFVVTTLLDHKEYPASSIAALYHRRWVAELFLRDIKITLGMDILSCLTPNMVEKELWMHVIGYNSVRAIMLQASLHSDTPIDSLSFKGTLAILRQWAYVIASPDILHHTREEVYGAMLDYIASDSLPFRPGRTEPRARKRRPKNYQLLNRPRGEFREIMHRNHYTNVLS